MSRRRKHESEAHRKERERQRLKAARRRASDFKDTAQRLFYRNTEAYYSRVNLYVRKAAQGLFGRPALAPGRRAI